ncbi:nuclear transcription factor Y subunit B-1-like [Rhododendron vialii]|uniref:nuclear transcription factor Y subunit B-1-like n=1 Tax=Rhododendron vialii TaxID=182163 RepID=UPI00265E5BD5|nr:nuclear transcription factor Y subunit B-1-like [Rhododendron vialii]
MAAEKILTSPIGSPSRDKELDQFLPIANVSRIMKKSLPTNAKISKEAKETVQTCVSEFISFITGEASDKCQREKRKTINGDDLLWAMRTLGFENYVGPLMVYLTKYRETEGDHLKNPNMSRQEEQPLSDINDTIINHEVIGYEENWVNGGFTMGNFHQLG